MESDRCFSTGLLGVTIALACIDGLIIATFAFSQLIRMQMRNRRLGWTRQKVFHLMIASSNVGNFVYFVSNLISTCKRWLCWSHACGFVLMSCPTILFQATFLLLLSFWVDLCHQANDEEEEDEEDTCQVGLLDKSKTAPGLSTLGHHRKCCSLHFGHVGSRQKFVILVVFIIFVMMMAFAVLIWIGTGKNPIDSSIVARVYIYFFAIAILLLAAALAVYGLVLFLKMSKVRSDKASFEMWKVASLAIVCFVCFTSSAVVALSTNIPLLYHWHPRDVNGILTSILVFLYYFIEEEERMGVFTFVCKSSGKVWSGKQYSRDLEASASSTFELQRKLVQAALSADSSGGVSSSFSLVTPSAVFQVIVGSGGGGGFIGGGGAAIAASSGGGAAAAEAPAAEEKKEEKEESDDDMGFSLFD